MEKVRKLEDFDVVKDVFVHASVNEEGNLFPNLFYHE